MSFELPDPKVPVFPGVNDSPIAPTALTAGNGAHLIQQHNLLVDILNFTLNAPSEPNSYPSLNKVLTEDITLYVDSANGNDNNDGLSAETAFISLQKASAIAASYFNPFNCNRIIKLLSGFYGETYLTGYRNSLRRENILILGNYDNPETVVINEPLYHQGGGLYEIQGVTFTTFSNNSCLEISNSRLQLRKVQFTGEASIHIYAINQALIEILDNYTIAGSATDSHIKLDSFSHLDFFGKEDWNRDININNDLAFANFVSLTRNSYLSAKCNNFSNSAIGNKFLADGNSVIDTDGENINLFPGDVPGILTKNSHYF